MRDPNTSSLCSINLGNSVAEVLDGLPDCVKVLSAEGVLRFINARGLALMEAESCEEVIGKDYAEVWPMAMRPVVRSAILAASAGEQTVVAGFCPTLKGSLRHWETHFHPLKNSAQRGAEVLGITRDVSERHERERQFVANEARYALILETAGDGIYEIGADGRCNYINPAGARLLGYTNGELQGMPLHQTIHRHEANEPACALTQCPIDQALTTGQARRVADDLFLRKDGSALPVSYSVYPRRGDTEVHGAVVIFTDNTERKRIEADLRRLTAELSDADRRKTEFIATLAHELRNPLAPVRTGLQILKKAGDSSVGIANVREMMERQVAQMVRLINDLLDIARVTSGKIELQRACIDLGTIVGMAVEANQPHLQKAGHRLTVSLPEEPLALYADGSRLAQVLTNLLNNAVKYTAPGGHLSLVGRRLATSVQVDISDTGVGIAPEALADIFDMFTKVGRNANGVQEGLGIGLNLARRLMQLHGGDLTASSGGIGTGSLFTLTLPLSVSRPEAAAPMAASPPPPPDMSVRILLVDDNVDAAETLSVLLESAHHEIRVVNSGRAALLAVEEFMPDIVFLDIGMPEMNGFEVAQKIRGNPRAGNPVLVALTGWGGDRDRQRSKKAGFDEHLTKPADLALIEDMISRVAVRTSD